MNETSKKPSEAFMSANLFQAGIGYVVVSRFKSQGIVESGVFLIDTYCLGVKNAFFARMGEHDYQADLLNRIFSEDTRESIEPACARKLVEDAENYARRLGFSPHSDYKQGCRVFGGIDSAACTRSFSFGKNGKPLYIQGPNDSAEMAHRILNLLKARCGQGNYEYIVLPGGSDEPEL
jgi:hypothetical protein